MTKQKHFNPYDGANVDQSDWQADQGYHKEQRRDTVDHVIRSGVVNTGLAQTTSLQVFPDSYRTNAHFINNRSYIDGNPLGIQYGENIRKAFAQKFIARSNNIQKVRLWLNTDLPPGVVMGHVVVEIRELQGTDCECDCRCICSSAFTAEELLQSAPKNGALASVKLDHNMVNNTTEFVDVPFFLQDRVSSPNSFVIGRPYAIVVYRDHLPKPQTGFLQRLSVHGNFNSDSTLRDGFLSVFDPSSGLWTDQPNNSVGFQIFSNTVMVKFGFGISEGQGYEVPRLVNTSTGSSQEFVLGNIDLVHFNALSVSGDISGGGTAVGRNVVIARAIEELTDLEPHPRTGNQVHSRIDPTYEVQVITEKDWVDTGLIDQCEWNLLAYVTDENRKTMRGAFDEPCSINPIDIVGNWVPSLINVDDCRALLPHSKIIRYSPLDPAPVSSDSIASTDTDRLTVCDPGESPDLYQADSIRCGSCQQTAFDAGNGLILTDATGGKHVMTVGRDGALRSESLIPPPVTGLKVIKDETSTPNNEAESGICCVDNGLKLRLTWSYPPDGTYKGIVIVRCISDYPRHPNEGTIIAATEDTYAIPGTSKTLNFLPFGSVNSCPTCNTPTGAGVIGTDADDSNLPCGCYLDSFGGIKVSTLAAGCGTSSQASIIAESTEGLSNKLIYHYAVFTYNRFGHFSAPTACAQAVYGSVDTIPPGGVCEFGADDQGGVASLTWINPSDADFTGIRIYKSTTGFVRDFHYEGNDAEVIYDTRLYEDANLTFGAGAFSLTPSDNSEFIDNIDNKFKQEVDLSYTQDVTAGVRRAFKFIGGRFTLSASTLSSGSHYYSAFTYDAAGNFSVALCGERFRLVLA